MMKAILISGAFGWGVGLAACGDPDTVCVGNSCVCRAAESCTANCDVGAGDCNVQCTAGEKCDSTCVAGESCDVECSTTPDCKVDCANSTSCHVTCPATGCSVKNCVGADCVVSCGTVGAGTKTGTTVTCP